MARTLYQSKLLTVTTYVHIIGPIGWTQNEKDGGLVLSHEKHWTKISGFFINTAKGCVWVQFRRWWKSKS